MNNPYFKVVETPEEMQIFKKIWLEVCEEMHFETEDFHSKETGMHFLIKSEKGDYVGTAEIGKFLNNEQSTVQYYYDFSQLDEVKDEMKNTYEVDKVCIYPEYRSHGLMTNMIYALLFHHRITKSVYFLSAMESKFFKALKRFYKVPMREVAPRQKFNDFYLHPLIVSVRKYEENIRTDKNDYLGIDYGVLDTIVENYLKEHSNASATTK